MPKRWILPPPAPPSAEDFARGLHVPTLIGIMLLARGITTPDAARRFLRPELDHLHDPFLLPDMLPAVERIARAVREGEKILVHGDYDVDGVCAAALVTRVLRVLKANVQHFVPHRQVEGYDLQPETVQRLAGEGVRLIVTVDCGIVAFESARVAKELGVDLIVTDHHEPHPEGGLPEALAVINPKRPGSGYPFDELCGTGVAYKLCAALLQHMDVQTAKFRTVFLDLVALATAADCMPLVDENRVFLKFGLDALRRTNKVGLKALMDAVPMSPDSVDVRSLGFTLGPRINAIGRMDAAAHALSLMLTGDASEGERLAKLLDSANRDRQHEQEKILSEAMRQAEQYVDDRILVLASPKWHPGIIGIVASKIAEALCRPTIMVAVDEENGVGRGSCRSVEGFHIFEALYSCRELLLGCGGHQHAAGFGIRVERLEELRQAMRAIGSREIEEELIQPSVKIDAELPPDALRPDLCRALEMLEPYGHGNHEPLFVTRGLKVLEQRRLPNKIQQGTDHLKLILETPHSRRGTDAVFWRAWPRNEECPQDGFVDVCYTAELNRHNGYANLQLVLRDVRPAQGSP